MKKIFLLLALLPCLGHGQLVTLNQGGHWNPISPTEPGVAAAFYNIVVTGYQDNPALYCAVRRNDSPPGLFCYATDALRDDGDTTTALVGLSGGTCLGSVQTSDCSISLTHRSGPSMTVSLQMKKVIAPTEPANLDLGAMNVSKVTLDSAIAQAVLALGDTLKVHALNFFLPSGDQTVAFRTDVSGGYPKIIMYPTNSDGTPAGGQFLLSNQGGGYAQIDAVLTDVLGDLSVAGVATFSNYLSATVLGTNSSGNIVSTGTTGSGSVFLQTSGTLDSPILGSGTANRVLWTSGSKVVVTNPVSGTGTTLLTNAGGTSAGLTVTGRLTADSLFATHLFAADTSRYKPSLIADTLAVTYRMTCTFCTASAPLYTDASKRLASGSFSGTGTTFALTASPTFTGTLGAANGYFSGNVGINNASPSYPLDVNGDIRTTTGIVRLDRTVSTNGSSTAFFTAGALNWIIGQGNSTAPVYDYAFYSASAAAIVFDVDYATGTITSLPLAGSGTRLITSTSAGAFGNATTIAGAYTWANKATFSDTAVALGFRSANYNAGGLAATFGGSLSTVGTATFGGQANANGGLSISSHLTISNVAGEMAFSGYGIHTDNYLVVDGDLGVGGSQTINGNFSLLEYSGGSGQVPICMDVSSGRLYPGTLSAGLTTCGGLP